MKISACWIVKNEESVLRRSIESVMNAADEIIVVDTGSEDNTVAIAEECGAKVCHFEWIDDFSAARNYAISQAAGNIIINLDADEWFEPALGERDRKAMEAEFTKDPELMSITFSETDVDKYGGTVNVSTCERIFRKHPKLMFVNRIHERLGRTDGKPIRRLSYIKHWNINHSGYQPEMSSKKAGRNLALLEKELEDTPEDGPARTMLNYYLMRESFSDKRPDKSLPFLQEILNRPGGMRRVVNIYGQAITTFIYQAIDLSVILRPALSRRQIRENLIKPAIGLFPSFPGTPTLDLVWQVLFEPREDILLKELDGALAKAKSMPEGRFSMYKTKEATLCYTAARGCLRRGNRMKALEYAVEPFKRPGMYPDRCLYILLSCIKGQPDADILALIASVMDIRHPAALDILVKGTRIEGYRNLHAYFVKKQIESGMATNGTFLFLQLLLGNYESSLEFALSLDAEANADVVRDHLFLLVLCTGSEDIYRKYSDKLEQYAPIFNAFFEGKPLENFDGIDWDIMGKYDLIAFVAGLEAADRFLSVFSGDPGACYLIKSKYLLTNQRYGELLAEDMSGIDPLDVLCRINYIEALLMAGRYDDVYYEVKPLLEAGLLYVDLFHQLMVVAEKSESGVRDMARRLHDDYITVSKMTVDLNDVRNTGVTFDDYDRKAKNALKLLNYVNFQKQLEADANLPATDELLGICKSCAEIYERKELYPAALECYRMLVAHNRDVEESRAGLARMFELLGNQALAEEIAKG